MEYSIQMLSLLTILLTVSSLAEAGWEHSCTYSDYFGGRRTNSLLSRCSNTLTEFVVMKCGGNVYLGSDLSYTRRKRDIMLSREDANTYLRAKRSMRQGIVCECCIYECNMFELEQYCGNKRRRRSLSDIVSGVPEPPAHHFSQNEVEDLYKKINEESQQSLLPVVLTSDDVRKIEIIEENKRENIEKEEKLKKTGLKTHAKLSDTDSLDASTPSDSKLQVLSNSNRSGINTASLLVNSLGLWRRDT